MKHIAIDFEYAADGDKIRHLICCVMHGENNAEMRFWLRNGKDTDRLKKTLARIQADSQYCLVAHAMELAEARCLKVLGMDPTKFRWRDTWMEAKLLSNSFFCNPPESCSLAECLAKYLDVQIDVEYKKECRAYCIMDATEGHEEDILDYCASDTKYLCDLAQRLLEMYTNRVAHSIYIHKQCNFSEQTLIDLAYMVNCSSEIASRGFPVDNDALRILKQNVPDIVMKLKRDFEEKYPGTYKFSTFKGKLKATKKTASVYDYLEGFLASVDMLEGWERTKSGRASTDSKAMKQFKHQDNFGGNYYDLQKTLVSVQGLVKEKDSWLDNWVEDDARIYYGSLRPMAASTGRFQPRISAGFIPGWAHFLYCVLNPAPGKMLFELDFHAQETALQSIICNDPKYAEVYHARDTYLWMAWQLGLITKEQYDSFPGDNEKWKKSLASIRGPMKTFTLAWSYGAGYRHLAQLANIKESQSKRWVSNLNDKVFKASTRWKRMLIDKTTGTKYHGLVFPDGFPCRTVRYKGEEPKSDTVKMNFPFQGFGAVIMRSLVKKCHELGLPAIATVHDAIIFECDDGDEAMVNRCYETMRDVARELLDSDLLEVGKPQYWRHHTLSDIANADLSSDAGKSAFVSKVGNLVEIDDVVKFQEFIKLTPEQ